MTPLAAIRRFYGDLITANAGLPPGGALSKAFAEVSRERFLGAGPWKVFTPSGYLETPSDDPAFLYQDITVGMLPAARINNGQPTLHALCLSALGLKEGQRVLHVGTGTGYYTAILAKLVGPTGQVLGVEIEEKLATQARDNLREFPGVHVEHRSGTVGPFPRCDVVYVSAGATAPMPAWLDALDPGGRLLFPLTAAQGAGGMLLIGRRGDTTFDARFITRAMFIPCVGARQDDEAMRLSQAFANDSYRAVRSLHTGTPPTADAWFAGRDWWLSTTPLPQV